MTQIPITSCYAALLGLIFVKLSLRTVRLRRKIKTALGDGDDDQLKRAIRAHANFSEYTPIALLLLAMAENLMVYGMIIQVLGIALLIGRSLHAYGLSQIKEDYRYRIAGMQLTLNMMIVSACLILWKLVTSST